MAWTAPRTWVANETLTAALLNTHVKANFDALDVAQVTAAKQYCVSTGANAVTARAWDFDRINTLETLVSPGAYTNLATVGPTVTVTTGTRALIMIAANMDHNTANGDTKMSYAVSGATTIAASDTWAIRRDGMPATNAVRIMRHDLRTDLTPGSNTFQCKYMGSAGTLSWDFRAIAVFPL